MGMRENWQVFLDITNVRAKAHRKSAALWDYLHNIFALINIFLNAVTAAVSLIKGISPLYVTIISSVSTVVATIIAFLKPAEQSQMQMECSRKFNYLLLSMVRCETEEEYEKLWRDLNTAILEEPIVHIKKKKRIKFDWTMTPELLLVVAEKEEQTRGLEDTTSKQARVARPSTIVPPDITRNDKPIRLIPPK